jgi:outer membrane protein assembly factor BamE (lipoprotein component of BamABCDE complex)
VGEENGMKSGVTKRFHEFGLSRRSSLSVLALALAFPLAACGGGLNGFNETYHAGYVPSQMALDQVSVGASKEQVEIALGSPSTSGDYGGLVYYYISQTRSRPVAFMNRKVVDQKILAVYFNKKDEVDHIANYGLKDGKIFDYASQTTPTGGRDQGFLEQVLNGTVGMGSPLGQ